MMLNVLLTEKTSEDGVWGFFSVNNTWSRVYIIYFKEFAIELIDEVMSFILEEKLFMHDWVLLVVKWSDFNRC